MIECEAHLERVGEHIPAWDVAVNRGINLCRPCYIGGSCGEPVVKKQLYVERSLIISAHSVEKKTPNRTITPEQREQMRREFKPGTRALKGSSNVDELSDKYGLSRSAVYAIVRGYGK